MAVIVSCFPKINSLSFSSLQEVVSSRLTIILVSFSCALSRWLTSFLKCHAQTKHRSPSKDSVVADSVDWGMHFLDGISVDTKS